ncbi:MAG: hypothetical protein IJZ29_01685 [Clostridia bacterium]|nr:hypothetical protein [Clostridia bacterium]
MEHMKNVIGTNINTYSTTTEVYNPTHSSTFYNTRQNVAHKSTNKVSRTNTLGKVRIACFFAIVSLLLFLFIYNFVAMANLNANIAGMEKTIATEQAYIDNLKTQINSLSSESAILDRVNSAGYSADNPVSDDILIVNVPKVAVNESKPQTNWFNDLCEYISSLFGG